MSYSELLTILQVHGFVAGEQDGLVLVLPDADARTMPTPLLTERETRSDSEIVTDTMQVKNAPAALFVPIIRPLMPQYGHFAADTCNNTLVIVDRFANVKRIEALVRRMDVGEPFADHILRWQDAPPPPQRDAPQVIASPRRHRAGALELRWLAYALSLAARVSARSPRSRSLPQCCPTCGQAAISTARRPQNSPSDDVTGYHETLCGVRGGDRCVLRWESCCSAWRPPAPPPRRTRLTQPRQSHRLRAIRGLLSRSFPIGVACGTSTIAPVAGGGLVRPAPPHLTPEYAAKLAAYKERQKHGEEQQTSDGQLRAAGHAADHDAAVPGEFLFTPGKVTVAIEAYSQMRRIFTDGRKHPDDPDPTYQGNSIGHWEGDTLVVDTVGFIPDSLIAPGVGTATRCTSRSASAALPMTSGDPADDLDPKVLTEPWT